MVCRSLNLPKFASNSQVFAASHQRVTFAGLGSVGDSRRFEKVGLPSSYTNHSMDPRVIVGFFYHIIKKTADLPRHTNAYSRLTVLGPTFVSLRAARPHPPGPNAVFKIRRYLISGR